LLDDEEKLVFGVGDGCSYTFLDAAGLLSLAIKQMREIVL